MKKYRKTRKSGQNNGILLMHNELRRLRSVLMIMLKEQEQLKEKEREKEKEKAKDAKHKIKIAKLKQRSLARIRSKGKRTWNDSCSQLNFGDNDEVGQTERLHCPKIDIITQQAQHIEQQKEKMHRIKLYYERQVANIKCSAQLLECQLNKLQALLQDHLEHGSNLFHIDRYYNEILHAVNQMQSHGTNAYNSPMVSQSSSKIGHDLNHSFLSSESMYIVDNAQDATDSTQLEHCPDCTHTF